MTHPLLTPHIQRAMAKLGLETRDEEEARTCSAPECHVLLVGAEIRRCAVCRAVVCPDHALIDPRDDDHVLCQAEGCAYEVSRSVEHIARAWLRGVLKEATERARTRPRELRLACVVGWLLAAAGTQSDEAQELQRVLYGE